MEIICPLCNGIQSERRYCPYCGNCMEERGPLQEFVDDYSPYLSQELGESLTKEKDCVHLFYCQNCQRDLRISLPRMTM